nr:hypothetical protein Iba_chr13bCG14210 [Ipomoea batatas]
MSSAFPMWPPRELLSSSRLLLLHIPHMPAMWWSKRMATVLKIALDDGGYEYNAPAASLEGDDDDDGGYDYAPAA